MVRGELVGSSVEGAGRLGMGRLQMVKGWEVRLCKSRVRNRMNMCWPGHQEEVVGIETRMAPEVVSSRVANVVMPYSNHVRS